METLPKAGAVCSECHSPLGSDGRCLPCLLRGGLPEDTLAESSPPPDAPPPTVHSDATVYGDFEITCRDDGSLWELGRGAMGVTYRAVDRVLHRPVALKVIQLGATPTRDSDWSNALRERFLREARAAAALRHANIAGVFQFGAADKSGRCYYAMELVEGETLEARVRRDGPLDTGTTLEVASQVAAALVAAAHRGLIHRDLKPSNLMLTDGGPGAKLEVKVIDFGLAKAAVTAGETDLTHGGFVGTPAFASPEQFERQPVDARTDIYSLGVTLWYALTGRVPFVGKTLEELRHHPARMRLPVEQLTAKKVPPAFVALLCAMLAEDPAHRPASARELATALENCRLPGADRGRPLPNGRKPVTATTFALLLALGAVLAGTGLVWWASRRPQPTAPTPAAKAVPAVVPSVIPEKSLAVLPFDNFSEDKDSAFFADGVQDEVLTDLAKVTDLKVISRTSVMPYKDPAKRSNLREIGQNLGVAYVVEGSVQRAGNKIRVNVQLIDARTDAHRWADRYDRDLADVFAIQSEIAQDIADELRTNVSPAEKAAISEHPTANLAAWALYTEAQGIFVWNDSRGADKSTARKAELLREAIQADPDFALAYCLLAKVQCDFMGDDGDSTHLAQAKQAAETALRLRPNMGEAHRELARCYLHAEEYDRARNEVAIARRLLPNDAEALRIAAETETHQNRWEDALATMQKAFGLDPNDGEVSYHLIDICRDMHRYDLWEQTLKKITATRGLSDEWITLSRAELDLSIGDLAAAQRDIAKVPMDFHPTGEIMGARYFIAFAGRDYAEAERVTATNKDPAYVGWIGGLTAHYRGDEKKAQAVFAAARTRLDADQGDRPKDADFFTSASRLDAGLGRKDEAIREARKAVELTPSAQDTGGDLGYAWNLAAIYAYTGEPDLAVDQLEIITKLPGGPSYGYLRFDPRWDSLRKNARFNALLASLVPKP